MKTKPRVPHASLPYVLSGLLAGLAGAGCETPSPQTSLQDRPDTPLWFDQDSVWGDDFSPAPSIDREWIAIPRTVWMDQLGLVASQLDQAYAAHEDARPRRSEVFLRRAASLIMVESARSTGEEKMALEMARRELIGLANAIAKGRTLETEEIRIAFAHTHYGLALHHTEKAWLFAEQSRSQPVALAMRAAADNLQRTWDWMDMNIRPAAMLVLNSTRNLAQKISDKQKIPPEELERALETLDGELVYTGLQIAPQLEQ